MSEKNLGPPVECLNLISEEKTMQKALSNYISSVKNNFYKRKPRVNKTNDEQGAESSYHPITGNLVTVKRDLKRFRLFMNETKSEGKGIEFHSICKLMQWVRIVSGLYF